MKKKDLDAQVAQLLGKKRREISAVTTAFLQEIRNALMKNRTVHLDRLGTLRVVSMRGTFTCKWDGLTRRNLVKRRINFRKARSFQWAVPEKKGARHGKVRSR